MKRIKLITGLSLIMIGILMIIISVKFLFGLGMILIALGILSLFNKNEDKIENIKYNGGKKNGKK